MFTCPLKSRSNYGLIILFFFFCYLTSFLIAEANNPPIIEGDCGAIIEVEPNGIGTAILDIYDYDYGDSVTKVTVSVWPKPDGDYIFDGYFLTFYPTSYDEHNDFVFSIRAFDNHNAMAYCQITFRCYRFSEIEPYEIKIEYEDGHEGGPDFFGIGVIPGKHAYVDVTLDCGSEVMLGYDFLIAYDNTSIMAYGAYPNPEIYTIPGMYEWEYFTYRFVNNCGDDCPSGLIQIISIADQNDGTHHPTIDPITGRVKILPVNTVLFTFDFFVSNDYTLECSFVPISFFWTDCTDNSIAMEKDVGYTQTIIQTISRDVLAPTGWPYNPITDIYSSFPTHLGAPEECLEINPENPPQRFIDFKNGGIKITCGDWDCRGDINLDGMCGSVADLVVFSNYFVYGLDAFKINIEGQKAATDVNSNGIPLTIEDFVYLTRLFTVDAVSMIELKPDSTGVLTISEFSDFLIVESSFNIPLGAMLLTFTNINHPYQISLDNSIPDMEMKTNLSGDTLKALIYSIEKNKNIPAGENRVLKISHRGGKPKLISSQAAGYFSEPLTYKTSIIRIPEQISLSQNYPNPFNSSTMIEFGLYKSGRWTINIFNISGQKVRTISGIDPAGSVQISLDGADENGITVSSGVYFYRLKFGDQSKTKKMLLLK